MTQDRERPPEELLDLVRRRSAARATRDFATADALRVQIEAAGWKPVDQGTHTTLERAAPVEALPSRLDEPPAARATVLIVAGDRADEVTRLLAALRATAPQGTQVVVVGDAPSAEQVGRFGSRAADLEPIAGLPPEVVHTLARLGHAAALSTGLRRAAGAVVVLADPSVEPSGDTVTPLVEALADPSVAVVGDLGLASADLRHVDPSDAPTAAAIEGSWLAFRRADAARLGSLDDRFVEPAYLDTWLSAVLRLATARSEPGGLPVDHPRLARRVDLPLLRHGEPPTLVAQRERAARRQFYRWLDVVRDHPELAVAPEGSPA